MNEIHVKSKNYSNKVISELRILLDKNLWEYKTSTAIAVTGSLGKRQLTPGSDIDLIVILGKTINKTQAKEHITSILNKTSFAHPFEYYPIETLTTWRWITKHSSLFCSDLFFSSYVWGNKKIFNDLIQGIGPDLDNHNRQVHFLYNLLYRDQQLKNRLLQNDLKYQEGGLRDMQFIKWVTERIIQCSHWNPVVYIEALKKSKFITHKESQMIYKYFSLIMTIKWNQESKLYISKKTWQEYDEMRMNILPIVNNIKSLVVKTLFSENYGKFIADLRRDQLDQNSRMILMKNGKELDIFCAIWKTNDLTLINNALKLHKESWTIRAAIAQNTNTPLSTLNMLISTDYPDMDDIVRFAEKNPNFKQ